MRLFLVPLLVDQLGGLISAAPDTARSADRLARSLLQGASPEQVISDFLSRLSGRAQDLAQNLLGGLAGL
ncbi:MAG: hypothetical protein WA990_04555 [Rubrobacteraceae bacterium]